MKCRLLYAGIFFEKWSRHVDVYCAAHTDNLALKPGAGFGAFLCFFPSHVDSAIASERY